MKKTTNFKEAVMRLQEREATFEGTTFKVRSIESVKGLSAMRLCAKHFTPEGREFIEKDMAVVMIAPDMLSTVELIGIDPVAEPEKVLFVFENWQNMQLAMCCRIPDLELFDIFEMIQAVPEFRKVVSDAAHRVKSPEEAKNA